MPAYLPNSGSSKPPPQWLVRLLSAVLAIGVLIIAIFLGGVILVTGAVLGVGLWGWLWWQKRKMVKMMGEQGAAGAQQWGPLGGAAGFGRPGAGGGAGMGAGPGAGAQRGAGKPGGQVGAGPGNRSDAGGQDQIIEGDFEVLDDDDPRAGGRR